MNGKAVLALSSALLFACAPMRPPVVVASPPAAASPAQPAPAERYVTIRTANCETLNGLPPEDRSAASMFYIGYQASRFRNKTINVGAIPDITSMALSFCAAAPSRTVSGAFAEAYLRARQ